MQPLDRRAFMRVSLRLALAAAAAAGGVPLLDLRRAQAALPAPALAVRSGKDHAALVREVLAALGGMSAFVRPGETVVVKPNIGWDRTPELAANTNPVVVRAVVELCLAAGAREVRVFDRTCNDPRRCYVQSGIQEAVEQIGDRRARIEHIDRRAFTELDIQRGVRLKRWEFYQPALDADRLINLPVAKHHSISRLTLGMKNLMGVIGGNRGVLHQEIDQALVDINLVIPSTLTVVDATRILVANGPVGGRLEDVRTTDTVIASPDIVAADSYATTLFGLQPADIPTLVTAARRGLGVMDLTKVRMV